MSKIAVVIKLPFGLISIQGPDAAKFLQGQITCDVSGINPKLSSLGAYCDKKGRILASFRLFMIDENYYLSMPRSILPQTQAELKKFAIFSKVTITDVSEEFEQFGLIIPESAALPQPLQGKLPHLPETSNEAITVTDNNTTVIRAPGVPTRFLLITHKNNLINITTGTSANDWFLMDINNGLATIDTETVGLFTPHQINFHSLGAVSFSKGCYRGQEIVARMHYLGKLKQHLYHAILQTEANIRPSMKIVNDNDHAVGEIVMAVKNNNKYELLVTVMDTAKENGHVFVRFNEDGDKVSANISSPLQFC